MKILDGDLYVSSVQGHIVSRFGSSMGGMKSGQIGVYPESELTESGHNVFQGMRWDTDEIVRIPRSSYVPFLKEYDAALGVGLKLRTKDEFDAQQNAIEVAEKKAADDALKAVAEAAKKVAEAAKQITPPPSDGKKE